MKRLASIFFCLTLCAAIVALSGGVAFAECCHAEACCCEGGEGCCCGEDGDGGGLGDAPCMAVVVHKLAPTDVTPTFHFSFIDHPLPLAPFLLAAWDEVPFASVAKVLTAVGEADTGPPRAYLRRLRVLRI